MWLLSLSVCLAIFHSSYTSSSEPHYVITVSNNFLLGNERKICVTLLDFKGEVDLKVELERNDQPERDVLVKHRIEDYQHSECFPFQVPQASSGLQTNLLHVSAIGENLNVSDSKHIMLFDGKVPCIIHSDKSTYKPDDTVKFHVMSVTRDFKILDKKFPKVEIIDPNNNRIAQWLDVTTKHGFSEFSFHLGDELSYGSYQINIPNGCEKTFRVDKYEPKRFEVNINAPSEVVLTNNSFHLDICGRYIYGKPVEGLVDLSVCFEEHHVWYSEDFEISEEYQRKENCLHLKGEKTDNRGCFSREIELGYFNFTSTAVGTYFRIRSKLTEGATGHSEKESSFVHGIQNKPIEFKECKKYYIKDSTYHCKVQVKNEMGQPKVNEDITLDLNEEEGSNVTRVKLVTDSNGIAEFTLNTAEWPSYMFIKARLSSEVSDKESEDLGNMMYYYPHGGQSGAMLWLFPYEPKTESLLTIQKHPNQISCNSDQSVTVEYDVHRKNLKADTDHLDFYYIILGKNGIVSFNEHKENIKDQASSPKVHGSFPINFHVGDAFPMLQLLVFTILPNGGNIARTTLFVVSPCAQNKMKLTFSEEQVRPGEHVDLEIAVDGAALCSVRSVDKAYLIDRPHQDSALLNALEYLKNAFAPDLSRQDMIIDDREVDLEQLSRESNLIIFTNTGSQELAPRMSPPKRKTADSAPKEIPKRLPRSYFPDTWMFELVPVGSDGHVVLNRTTPHGITKWVTDAFCLGEKGLGGVTDVELTTFQPYFIDLIIPSSVVQGEKFTIEALVFNYEKKCILIVVALTDSEDLITAQDKEQARCVCEGHSHRFAWDVSATKLKTLKIHVESGSIEVEGSCTEDVLLIGKDHRTDSVEKTLEVKPKGFEDEKIHSFLLFPADNREAITFNMEVPARLVPGSERAHVLIMGDLMANVILHLEYLVDLPDGCGEQNAAKMARYVSTMDYLENRGELTPEQKAEFTQALSKGYQKQLTHRTENGSYAAFFDDGNIWATAFVVKILNGAKKYIPIDEKDIQESINWLQSKQQPNGCFELTGHPFNNYQEGDSDSEIMCTAYVAVALLEHEDTRNGSIVENALSCLRNSLDSVSTMYTRALLAYAFILSGDIGLRHQMLEKVEERYVNQGDFEDLETASYVLLTVLSNKIITEKNVMASGEIVRWILKQQNSWGGFGSSQDTAIALQALAKYAKATYREKGDSTVTIRSESGFEKITHVDKSNSFLVQMVDLPDIPGKYSISATGEGVVYIQPHLHYNVLPEQHEKEYFSFNVSTEPCDWTHASKKEFNVHVNVRYLGKRENTNMALIILDMVSGYVPDRESVKKLKKHPLVERTEISAQNVTIYLSKLNHEPISLDFSVEQEAVVENLQPATAVVLDYYDTDEHTVIEYSAPWNSVVVHCVLSTTEREDCGHATITKEQCEEKGCCFDSSIPETKWCFHHGFKKIENH